MKKKSGYLIMSIFTVRCAVLAVFMMRNGSCQAFGQNVAARASWTYRTSIPRGEKTPYDPYNVYDYSSYEDFYDDNREDFEGIDDTEDYYDEKWDDWNKTKKENVQRE